MRILSCIESFLPGDQGGGPVRALDNLTQQLGVHHCFDILTRNYDYLDPKPYFGMTPNVWVDRARGQICYATDDAWADQLRKRLQTNSPDWLYLHGAFAPMTRGILRLRRQLESLRQIPLLIAPHGNFGPASLRHHAWRKQAWLAYAKARGLYRDIRWHAASEREAGQIQSIFGVGADIRMVPMAPAMVRETGDLPASSSLSTVPPSGGSRDALRLVYFGRLSPEKNLGFAFELLRCFAQQHPETKVVYDIYYLGEADPVLCQQARELPASVSVNFISNLSHSDLQARLRGAGADAASGEFPFRYHAMLMPSLTENFSYTVLESFQAGIPVLISDQTPWTDLEAKGVGWDFALDDKSPWLSAMESLTRCTEDTLLHQPYQIVRYADAFVGRYPGQAEQLFQ